MRRGIVGEPAEKRSGWAEKLGVVQWHWWVIKLKWRVRWILGGEVELLKHLPRCFDKMNWRGYWLHSGK
jgi:hypothetical protein